MFKQLPKPIILSQKHENAAFDWQLERLHSSDCLYRIFSYAGYLRLCTVDNINIKKKVSFIVLNALLNSNRYLRSSFL